MRLLWSEKGDVTVAFVSFSDDRKEWREFDLLFCFTKFDLKAREVSFGRVKDVELEVLMLPDEADARFPDRPEPRISSLFEQSPVFLF